MSDIEITDDLRNMVNDENQPFQNKDGWRIRLPYCPTCDTLMEKTGRVVELGLFNDKKYNLCQKQTCKQEDHLERTPAPEVKCTSDDCKDTEPYVPDLLYSEVNLRCKCNLGDNVKWGQLVYHINTTHAVTKHDFIQMMMDNKRPRARKIAPGQEYVWLEKKKPSKTPHDTTDGN